MARDAGHHSLRMRLRPRRPPLVLAHPRSGLATARRLPAVSLLAQLSPPCGQMAGVTRRWTYTAALAGLELGCALARRCHLHCKRSVLPQSKPCTPQTLRTSYNTRDRHRRVHRVY